jgi:hypothetical protein
MTSRGGIPASLLLLVVLLTGCQAEDAPADDPSSVHLTPIGSTSRFTVELSRQADERLGISTAAVARARTGGPSGGALTLPYAAVVYDSDGSSWAYVEVAPDTYARHRIDIVKVVGGTAYLRTGPHPGARVVVVGAPELLGAEYQISGEE